jgi:MFS family permease
MSDANNKPNKLHRWVGIVTIIVATALLGFFLLLVLATNTLAPIKDKDITFIYEDVKSSLPIFGLISIGLAILGFCSGTSLVKYGRTASLVASIVFLIATCLVILYIGLYILGLIVSLFMH